MKKLLLSTVAALLTAGVMAVAADLPNFTGPQDPSQLNATMNQMNANIRSGVNGLIAFTPGASGSAATTAEQTLATTSVPASTIAKTGQTLFMRCSGGFAFSGHTNTIKLYYGTSVYSSGPIVAAASLSTWSLELYVTNAGSSTSGVIRGLGAVGASPVFLNATTNAVDDMTTALTAKCTATQGTAAPNDVTITNFFVEQIK